MDMGLPQEPAILSASVLVSRMVHTVPNNPSKASIAANMVKFREVLAVSC